jgi:pimeloyl-ACP methyl ester carboxylesterase
MSEKRSYVRFKNGLSGVVAGSAGHPVFLLHPIGLASYTWRNVQPALAEECRTVALDLLGFGQSAKPANADYSFQANAERILQVADELGWDRVHLVGNSLGGGVSLATAVAAPERVASLSLIDTVAYPGGMPPLGLLAQVPLAEHPARLTSHVAAHLALRYCSANRRHPERHAVRTYASVLRSRDGVRAFRLTSQAIYGPSLAALSERYRDIRCPALILHGDQDPIIPRWVPERLKSELRDAELRWLARVGHFPQEEDPEQLIDCLVPFLYDRDRVAA